MAEAGMTAIVFVCYVMNCFASKSYILNLNSLLFIILNFTNSGLFTDVC